MRENQQAGVRASQSGSERAPDSRVERRSEREGECMCGQRERRERQLESLRLTIEWER